MSADGLLTFEKLLEITEKKRPHCQRGWFKREFDVDLPCNSKRVIISEILWEALQAKRAGLQSAQEAPTPDRPKIYSLKKSA